MELAFRARIPGNSPLQLHELDPTPPTRITETPLGTPWHRPMLTRGYQSSMGHLQDASLADWDTHTPSKVQQRQLQANAPHGAQAPTLTCCSSTDQAPALASRLGFIYPKSPHTNRATLAPASAPPTQRTAIWSTIAPSTHSPCLTGPSMDVSLPTRIQPLSNTTGVSQQDKRPGSNRTSQALGGTCHSPLAKTYATATWIGSRHPTRSPYHGPPPQDGRTGMITHTNRALPNLPLLTDQVCRKADSDGTHPAGPVTSQACRSSRTRLSTARTPTQKR